MNTNVEVSTKARKDAPAIKTNLTINWDGMTPEEMRELAQAGIVIKWQADKRENGIPTEETINAVDYKVGNRKPKSKPDVVALLMALSPEDRAAALAKAGIEL